MRFIALLCFALAFLFACFGWHISHAGAAAMAYLGLFFLTLSGVYDWMTYRRGPVA